MKFVVCLASILFCAQSFAMELRTAAQDSYPKYFSSEGEMGGICYEILSAVDQHSPDLTVTGSDEFLPFKRLQAYLEHGTIDMFFGLKNTPKRQDKFVFLDQPLYELHYVLAVHKNDDVSINTLEEINTLEDQRVISVSGSAASRFVEAKGVKLLEKVDSPEKALELLRLKRVRFVFYHDLGLGRLILDKQLGNDIKLLPVAYHTYHHSVAFNKDVSPDLIKQVEHSLDALESNGTLGKIRARYGLN